jgi:hypothetical protein
VREETTVMEGDAAETRTVAPQLPFLSATCLIALPQTKSEEFSLGTVISAMCTFRR